MHASFPLHFPLLHLLHSSSIIPLKLKKSEKKTKENGVWGTAQEAPTPGRDGTRERPRDATFSSGPSRAVTHLPPTLISSGDSRVAARPRSIKSILNPIPDLGRKSPPHHHSPKFGIPGHNSINPADHNSGHNSGYNYYFALFTTTTYFTRKTEYVEQLKPEKFIVQSKNKKITNPRKINYKS